MSGRRARRVGLVLGSGAARGWAHIGVIRALAQAGIRPALVCGTSIGALVGAAYAAGELDRLEQWARGITVKDIISLMDVSLSGGVLKGEKLVEFLRRSFADRPLEGLPVPFAAVATDLRSGEEVWLREGSMVDAVRASIALPGLFTPVVRDGMVLADGGLVNPVPVSLGRAMGAEILIAVDLNSDLLGRHLDAEPEPAWPAGQLGDWLRRLQGNLGGLVPGRPDNEPRQPSLLDVVASSINVMQVRITRSRMAGGPPDAIVPPRLARFGLLDFHRAQEAIEEGRRAAESALGALRPLLAEAP